MMVCRMESRSSEEVRALATSWKMLSSWLCRLRSASVASVMPGGPSNYRKNGPIIGVNSGAGQQTLVSDEPLMPHPAKTFRLVCPGYQRSYFLHSRRLVHLS